MSITASQITHSTNHGEMKRALESVRAGTATASSLGASLLTLEEKRALDIVRAGGATRAQINSMLVAPNVKELLLNHAGV